MNGSRFDSLTRKMADSHTRRSVLRGLAGVGGMLVATRVGDVLAGQSEKVTICHKPGTPAQQTLVVAASAVGAHLGHGDLLGACGVCSVNGAMECDGTGFRTCDNGAWVYRDCPPGTLCRSSQDSILCDWPQGV